MNVCWVVWDVSRDVSTFLDVISATVTMDITEMWASHTSVLTPMNAGKADLTATNVLIYKEGIVRVKYKTQENNWEL